jgi:hypothetical protein
MIIMGHDQGGPAELSRLADAIEQAAVFAIDQGEQQARIELAIELRRLAEMKLMLEMDSATVN